MIEDIGRWEEVGTVTLEERVTHAERTIANVIERAAHITRRGLTLTDGMSREIEVGDIITWNSGGYYTRHASFGKVLRVSEQPRSIRVLNHNKNTVTIWNTYDVLILAKNDNYDLIPDRHKEIFDVM